MYSTDFPGNIFLLLLRKISELEVYLCMKNLKTWEKHKRPTSQH